MEHIDGYYVMLPLIARDATSIAWFGPSQYDKAKHFVEQMHQRGIECYIEPSYQRA